MFTVLFVVVVVVVVVVFVVIVIVSYALAVFVFHSFPLSIFFSGQPLATEQLRVYDLFKSGMAADWLGADLQLKSIVGLLNSSLHWIHVFSMYWQTHTATTWRFSVIPVRDTLYKNMKFCRPESGIWLLTFCGIVQPFCDSSYLEGICFFLFFFWIREKQVFSKWLVNHRNRPCHWSSRYRSPEGNWTWKKDSWMSPARLWYLRKALVFRWARGLVRPYWGSCGRVYAGLMVREKLNFDNPGFLRKSKMRQCTS